MPSRTQGFTLIELLIVIAIIGILAAVLIPNLLGAQKRAYDTGAQACAKSLQTALATRQIDTQAYTLASNDKTGLVALDGTSTGCSNTNIAISAVTAGVSSYSFIINDVRGKNGYTVTPSTLSAN